MYNKLVLYENKRKIALNLTPPPPAEKYYAKWEILTSLNKSLFHNFFALTIHKIFGFSPIYTPELKLVYGNLGV